MQFSVILARLQVPFFSDYVFAFPFVCFGFSSVLTISISNILQAIPQNNSPKLLIANQTFTMAAPVPPSNFVCPLTEEIMVHPVMTKYGKKEEREEGRRFP